MSSTTLDHVSNGHSHVGVSDARRNRSSKAADAPKLPSVQITPEDKAAFQAAAERAGLHMIDAMSLAVQLLEDATASEKAETPAERIARIRSQAMGSQKAS